MAYKVPRSVVILLSPVINFKSTGDTVLFTTAANEMFAITDIALICTSATAAGGDANYNLGFTGPNYNDFTTANAFNVTTPNYYFSQGQVTGTQVPLIPVGTAFRVNVTSADTGTALTGYFVIQGFTI